MTVFDLWTYEQKFQLARSKGCTAFAVDTETETYRLCCAVKKKLLFFSWTGDRFVDQAKVGNIVCFCRSLGSFIRNFSRTGVEYSRHGASDSLGRRHADLGCVEKGIHCDRCRGKRAAPCLLWLCVCLIVSLLSLRFWSLTAGRVFIICFSQSGAATELVAAGTRGTPQMLPMPQGDILVMRDSMQSPCWCLL